MHFRPFVTCPRARTRYTDSFHGPEKTMKHMSAHIAVGICTLMSYAIPLRIYSVVILTVFRLGSGAALSPNASPCAFDKSSNQTVGTWVSIEPRATPLTPVFDLTPLPLHSLVLTQKFLGRKDYRSATFEEGRWHSTSSPRLRSFRLVNFYSLAKNYTTFRICDFVHITANI